MACSRTYSDHFLNMSFYGDSRAIGILLRKKALTKIKVFLMKE